MKKLRHLPDWQLLLVLGIVLIPVRAWITRTAGLEMHFDEAQYWTWSQQLDWSYYSKGPLIAWLIAMSESILGHGEWQTRLFGWLSHSLLLVVVFYFSRQVWNDRRSAWWALILMATTPLYFSLSLVMTTDNLMLMFWAWGLWAAYRALIMDRPRAWYEVGAAVGLGSLTKLTIGLLPAILGLILLGRKSYWHHLRRHELWTGLLLVVIGLSPILFWNAQHDWVMLRHNSGHLQNGAEQSFGILRFVVGQILVLSPLVAVIALIKLWRPPASQGPRLLWLATILWFTFFLVKALDGKVQINWPAPTYISLIVLLAGLIPRLPRSLLVTLYAGIVSSTLLMTVLLYPAQFGLAGDKDPFKKNKYWRTPVSELATQLPGADFILTDGYRLASELAYYWPQSLPVYLTGRSERRFNQYDLWPAIAREAGHDALYIIDRPQPHPLLSSAFRNCQHRITLPVKAADGTVIRTLYAYHCTDYSPIDWPAPGRY